MPANSARRYIEFFTITESSSSVFMQFIDPLEPGYPLPKFPPGAVCACPRVFFLYRDVPAIVTSEWYVISSPTPMDMVIVEEVELPE
jgi:hypothetical protein